jgi:methionyl aminopeptidase
MIVRDDQDIRGLIKIGRICTLTMRHMLEHVEPGITTGELDRIGAAHLAKYGAKSAPMQFYKYPAHTCISVNEEVAHGIPGARVIQPGDVVNVDVSAVLDGYVGDTGGSMVVPPVTEIKARLLERTKATLDMAVEIVTADAPLNLIGRIIEGQGRKYGYRTFRELGGHGVGPTIHEEPRNIPNYWHPRLRDRMVEGTVFTIEPFYTIGKGKIRTLEDKWTIVTVDGAISAQFEHTIVVTRGKPILTTLVD